MNPYASKVIVLDLGDICPLEMHYRGAKSIFRVAQQSIWASQELVAIGSYTAEIPFRSIQMNKDQENSSQTQTDASRLLDLVSKTLSLRERV